MAIPALIFTSCIVKKEKKKERKADAFRQFYIDKLEVYFHLMYCEPAHGNVTVPVGLT